MPFEKGKPRPKNAGRTLGTPNKNTATAKESIQRVFELLQASDLHNLEAWAKENPESFYTKIWIKLVPTAVDLKAEVETITQIFKIGDTEIEL